MPAYIDFVCRILKLILDTYIFVMFVYMFQFFVGRKKAQLIEADKELSRFNRFVIVWTLSLVALNYLHSAANLIYNPLIANFSVMKDEQGYKVF